MGKLETVSPAMLLLAAFSKYDDALEWAREQSTKAWGPIALSSSAFDFTETDYYAATMGTGLKKTFWAFERLIDPAELPQIKLLTNAWEAEYAALGRHPQPRPLNLDPGYLTPAKLVLATTKDHAHRLYLGDGIFGEVTLVYADRRWQPRDWTYPDYRRADYQRFFLECRTWLRERLRQSGP